jgi:transposase
MKGMITLSKIEQRKNDIMVKLMAKEIKVKDAARLLGISERQVYRKKVRYKQDGILSIPHKSKNKSTGKGYSSSLKKRILHLYITEYPDWNFHHFNDFLEELHNIKVSDSFIYKL